MANANEASCSSSSKATASTADSGTPTPAESVESSNAESLCMAAPRQKPSSEALVEVKDGNSGGADSSIAQRFQGIYAGTEWGGDVLSGLGSREDTTKPFCAFLEAFLRGAGIRSVVDGGCGHWPSGYQRFIDWCGVSYLGVDVVPRVIEDNREYFSRPSRLAAHGVRRAEFAVADCCDELPAADLLMVKDVLMHLPNRSVRSFIASHIKLHAPSYRYIMLVHNEMPINFRSKIDIKPGQLMPFDISQPPFNAPFTSIFRWKSDEPKVVQLWDASMFKAGDGGQHS
eukprot:gnl/TRDRNA2_/TRDRNA2_129233_c0_seq1.p1 gnl/TRDRNA2_/TRDRNA2_129233_c0~~gnl/TRDRNA2_/TRDRNA2_129233_c0_seq1.p1  ORF type:complete len:321 (-),score=42.79 gnl/TRDRNA2_/TRDRNA2_129233_c0_seq1:47-904(-)